MLILVKEIQNLRGQPWSTRTTNFNELDSFRVEGWKKWIHGSSRLVGESTYYKSILSMSILRFFGSHKASKSS